MIYPLVFVPLVVVWALLHRASCRPGWSFVGRPPSQWEILMRARIAELRRITVAFVDLMAPVLAEAQRAFNEFAKAVARTPIPKMPSA